MMNKKSEQLIGDMKRKPVSEEVIYVNGVKIIGQELNEPSEAAVTNFKRTFKDFIRDKRIKEQEQATAN